jgi:hypothetical protein
MRIYAPSRMQSVKDLPAETRLKFRCEGDLGCRLGPGGPGVAAQAGRSRATRRGAGSGAARPPAS